MKPKTSVRYKKPSAKEKKQTRRPFLTLLEGADAGLVYPIARDHTLIGRSEAAAVWLNEEGVSREHAQIDREAGAYRLTDLGSTNGTFLNGETVEQAFLQDGDKIRLGEVLLRFGFQDGADLEFQESLRDLALRDGVTRSYNRRYLLDALVREYGFARRKDRPLSVLLLDVDEFQRVVETHGQEASNHVLRDLSDLMAREIRAYDTLGRYEGDSFVILLREAGLEAARSFANRLREKIGRSPFFFQGTQIGITVSVGVSEIGPQESLDAESFFQRMNRDFVQARVRGRDQVLHPGWEGR